MSEATAHHEGDVQDTGREKTIALYSYLKELSNLRISKVLDISRHPTPAPYIFYLDELPHHLDYVEVSWRDMFEEEEDEEESRAQSDCILKVKKPSFQKCPSPPEDITPWLARGWDDRANEAPQTFPGRRTLESGDTEYLPLGWEAPDPLPAEVELFDDDPNRVSAFSRWVSERGIWLARQREIEEVQDLFIKLCAMRDDLNRESETFEVMFGAGFLTLRQNPDVNHPVLLKRAAVRFNANDNVIFIEDDDSDPELYTSLLHDAEGLTLSRLQEFENRVASDCVHPLDRNNAPLLLRELAHSLTPKSEYEDSSSRSFSDPSVELRIYNRPVMFMRKKLDGTARAIERVIEDIEDGSDVPKHLLQIVDGGEIPVIDYEPETIEQKLAEVGGEDTDILLSKEANREQLEIARRIEHYDAVLVQGPPGTGKTHTIANLTGHFLSQGKSVLITSQTPKVKWPKSLDCCKRLLTKTQVA